MPLYQTIIICKIGPPKNCANLAKKLSTVAIQNGANIRNVSILGDSLTKCNDNGKYMIGRYLQILYDANINCTKLVEKEAKKSFQFMNIYTLRDYYNSGIQFTKPIKQSMIHSQQQKQRLMSQIASIRLRQK